jgi:hypothetical protein
VLIILGEGSDGEDKKETEDDGAALQRPTDTTIDHRPPKHAAPGCERTRQNKPEIGLTQ